MLRALRLRGDSLIVGGYAVWEGLTVRVSVMEVVRIGVAVIAAIFSMESSMSLLDLLKLSALS